MPDKDTWINSLQSLKVPENLSQQAADILSRQDAGELPYPLPEKEQHVVTRAWRCSQIKQAIEARIERNHINGVQFMEGQLLPRGITLEVACEIAEYWERGMNDEALTLIATLPQRDIIGRIYCAIAEFDWQPDFELCDDIEFDFSDLFEVVPEVERQVSSLIEGQACYDDFLAEVEKTKASLIDGESNND